MMASRLLFRSFSRPPRSPPSKLPILPCPLGTGGPVVHVHNNAGHYRRDRPGAEPLPLSDERESDLTRDQLEELFAGRFPANYFDEVIHLSKLSRRDIHRIFNAFDPSKSEGDRRPPGHVFVDRRFSRASVHLAPSAVHDSAIQSITKDVWGVIDANVRDHETKFLLETNCGTHQVSDFSTKIPDVMIYHCEHDWLAPLPFFVAEVGFTEDYDELVASMKKWLRLNDTVKIAFLVKFEEHPEYRGRKCLANLVPEVIANPQQYINDPGSFRIEKTSEGKLKAHGAAFVGRISAFLEIWERHVDSGEVVRRGERINFYDSLKAPNPPEVSLPFEAFAIREEELKGRSVTFNWKRWVAQVEIARKALALFRFRVVINNYILHPKPKKENRKGKGKSQK